MRKIFLCISFCLILIAVLTIQVFSGFGAVYASSNGVIFESVVVKNMDAPVAGNKPDYTVTRGSNHYSIYPYDGIVWYDQTSQLELSDGDSFVAGHSYSVRIWLKAKIDLGYSFHVDENGESAVTGTLNGQTVKVNKVAGHDPVEVIELYYEFDACPAAHHCSPVLVNRVEPTCTESGKEAYYHCSCGMNYKDAVGEQQVNIITWGDIPALGHVSSGWEHNHTHHYKVCTRPGCETEIPNTEYPHSGSNASCMQKAVCLVCGALYGDLAEHCWTFSFTYQDATGHAHRCQTTGCTAHSQVIAHDPGTAATDSDPQLCKDCGYIMKAALNHTHSLKKVSAKAATCMESGNREYYTCSGCNDWFADSKGKNVISDKDSVNIATLGHQRSDWMWDVEHHWRECAVCDVVLDEFRAAHSDDNKDVQCDTCGCVMEAIIEAPSEPTKPTESTTPAEPTQASEHVESTKFTEPQINAPTDNASQSGGIPWWSVVLVALCAAGAGAAAVFLLMRVKFNQ